jgi:hypothetical protein
VLDTFIHLVEVVEAIMVLVGLVIGAIVVAVFPVFLLTQTSTPSLRCKDCALEGRCWRH